MRTTLDIKAPVLKDLRELQWREGGTLGELVSRLLAEALARRPRKPVALVLEWTAKPMGALVDPVRGNLVPDAHLAALLRQNGGRALYTRDGDFRKFSFLDVRDPFAG